MQPVLHARQHPLGRLIQPVAGPAVDHHGQHRVHRQPPQHEGQRLHRPAVGPLQIIDQRWPPARACCSPTTSSNRAPTANDEAPSRSRPRAGPAAPTPPAARSSWSTSPKSRSVSAWSARADSTLRPAAWARQRRARAVFPTPGSPSMATSHGCPGLRPGRRPPRPGRVPPPGPRKHQAATGRSCTRPPHSLVTSATPGKDQPNCRADRPPILGAGRPGPGNQAKHLSCGPVPRHFSGLHAEGRVM